MEIKYKFFDNTLKISFFGELDESSAENARNYLDLLIEKKSPQKIIFDFGCLSFMDSTGIGVLLGRYKKCKAKKIKMMITSPNKSIDKLFNLSGIYSIIPKIS